MIVRNVAWNVFGLGVPLLVAVVCIPPLLSGLGAPRFGLLTLVWAVSSYFGLFDLGLGRAITQQVSAAMGAGREDEARQVAGVGLTLLAVVGVVAGLALWGVAPWGVRVLKDLDDVDEAIRATRAMAVAMPFVIVTSGLRGAMEARGAFAAINRVRLVIGVATFALPLAVLRAGLDDLGAIATALALLRVVGCVWYAFWVVRLMPGVMRAGRLDATVARRLLGFGGWLMVSNVVGPLMSYLDRFLIGSVLSMAAVAWYVTPQEIVTKLLIVAASITSVLFPRLSELHAGGDAQASRRIERGGLLAIYVLLFPVTLAFALGSGLVLRLWVGETFALESSAAMSIFCFGVLLNSLAHVPYAAIQARGRADLTAWLQLAELPLFVAAIVLLVQHWGVPGAALAWTLRVAIDFAALSWFSRCADRAGPGPERASGWVLPSISALTLAAFGALAIDGALARAAWGAACATAALAVALVAFRDDLPRVGPLRHLP